MNAGPVAIIGRACVLPGANSPEALWDLVRSGRSAVSSAPGGRWRLDHSAIQCGPDDDSRDRTWSDKGGYVQGFDALFDPRGFAVPPEHFDGLDPLFLWTVHTAREALRDAGDAGEGGRGRVGAIFGNLSYPSASMNRFAEATWFDERHKPDPRNRFTSSGPARLLEESLGLGAGAFCLDAACASALYAIKLAIDRLQDGQADVMLAGAVNCADDLFIHVGFCALQAMSRTGQSRPFHAEADGLVPAEGAAFVVLKRLGDAERDGDRIRGVIRGVGLSNDGRGPGLLAPSELGQARAIRRAYEVSGVDPASVSLLECHATGTPVGDGVEIKSSARVFGPDEPLPIGSLKSNMGHLITAAGVAGLIKVLEAMRHGERPPTIGIDKPSRALDGTPFRLLAQVEPWVCEGPRIAGISAFGFGGNNAHLVVSEYRPGVPIEALATEPVGPLAVVGVGGTIGSRRGLTALFEAASAVATKTSTIPVSLRGLRFPPRDLQQSLPQQVVVLEAARDAVADAGLALPPERTGVIVAMEADPEVSRFGARWRMGERAARLGSTEAWCEEARDRVIETLDAAGVVGHMPNIVANRINSQLDLGGLGFTVSAGPDSGLIALKLAARCLRQGELDACVVGAVDLSCEPVHQAAARQLFPEDRQLAGDAAVVLVLQRLDVAREQGARVLAVLEDEDGDDVQLRLGEGPDGSALRERVGLPFAAESLVHAAVGTLALHLRTRPGGRPWLPPARGPRRCLVEGADSSLRLVLQEATGVRRGPDQSAPRLHVYGGRDREAVLAALASDDRGKPGPFRLVIVASDEAQRAERASRAIAFLRHGAPAGRGVHCRETPIEGQLALVFTGAGAAYRGMGGDLLAAAPELADRVRDRFSGVERALAWAYDPSTEGQRPTVLQQLWGASAVCQVHAALSMGVLGLRPEAVIGYSSGETNALFALGIWSDLDAMVADSERSGLFDSPPKSWACWMVLAAIDEVTLALRDETRLHLSIVHCRGDYVVAGDEAAAERFVDRIGRGRCMRLDYELAVHVPEVNRFREEWLDLHTRKVSLRPDVRVYSNACHGPYAPGERACAEAILNQANRRLDLPATIERAWNDGVRVFVEHGPQALCGRWIQQILGERDAVVVSLDRKGQGLAATLDAVAALVAAGVDVDLAALDALTGAPAAGNIGAPATGNKGPSIDLPAHRLAVDLPPALGPVRVDSHHRLMPLAPALPSVASSTGLAPAAPAAPAAPFAPSALAVHPLLALHQQQVALMAQAQQGFVTAQSEAHRRFVEVQRRAMVSLGHRPLPEQVAPIPIDALPPPPPPPPLPQPPLPQPALAPVPAGLPGPKLGRAQLEVHASGAISEIFGPAFRAQDAYARQVRMPEPPLLLADRVTGIDAEPATMGLGTIWTETDVTWGSWYLHQGAMPPGIMIEAGQADLMLISWLGVDLLNRGERVYRLLGCELTYHGPAPRPGDTLSYDIHIDGHANQGPVRLMFFHYECQVDGQPRLTVREGQAGFFTDEELAGSAGCLWTPEGQEITGDPRLDPPQIACTRTAFDEGQVRAFSEGRPWDCFGPGFEGTKVHERTPRVQDGRMLFVDRVTDFQPRGGPWSRGYLRAEAGITPDAWFFDGHFNNDPCMPGTLMFEGCLQAMSVYMAAMGFTVSRDGWRFQPVQGEPFQLRCRGQAVPTSRELVYEVFVEEVSAGPTPTLYADLLCTIDGLKAFHARRVGLELVPDWPMTDRPELFEGHAETRPVVMTPEGFAFDYYSLLACAWGRPSDAFGPSYRRFDGPRQVARLPGPPYHFITRVLRVEGALGELEAGALVEVEFDIDQDAWYFAENGNRTMPHAVLLEAALQPCGWLASYVGSALVADEDLCFRNLDGTGDLTAELFEDAGTLRTVSRLTSVSRTGSMIIESFQVECFVGDTRVYAMNTVFGFFPAETMANQVGLPTTVEQRVLLTEPSDDTRDLRERTGPLFAAGRPGLPQPMMLMLDRITGLWLHGGQHGKGRIRGEKDVDPGEWFFKAHFFQDPVQPGSLGIEAMIQLLQVFMLEAGMDRGVPSPRFEPIEPSRPMTWKYRGQVVPHNSVITTTLDIVDTGSDERGAWAVAEASLWVDNKRIYEASSLGMRIVSGKRHATVLDPDVDTWLQDHRPTWTVPALPMMNMVELLARGSRGEGEVIALRDVRVKGWFVVDRRRQLRTERDGERVRLVAEDDTEVASARVVRGAWTQAPAELARLDGPKVPLPYDTGALFHGPAFQVLESLVTTASGASSVLRAEGGVPVGLLNPGLLDGAAHAIPHDALDRWFPAISPDRVAYPAWIPDLTFHGPTPTEGAVCCEVRPDGFVGSTDFPAFRIQLIGPGGVWASFRLVEACFPKGPLGSAEPQARRAFLRDKVHVPDLSLSSRTEGRTRLRQADVDGSNWLPGTIKGIYGTEDVEVIATHEHIAAAHALHPCRLPGALPLTRFDLDLAHEGEDIVVSGDSRGRLDLSLVRAYWTAWFDRGPWPVEDLYYGLIERFTRRVVVEDPAAFEAIRGRSTVYLANHQTGVESLLFSIVVSALSRMPTVTLAKIEHKTTWLGRLIDLCFRYPGVRDPRVIAFFDRQDKASLVGIIADLAAEMAGPGRSVMVHVEGTRSLSCREPVAKMSGAFIDMALGVGAPIVPVRFTGGLPADPVDKRLEFPVGMGTQDIWLGRPLVPEELSRMHYGQRKETVISAINGLGPANSVEVPHAPGPAFAARVEDWVMRTGATHEHATLGCLLAHLECPGEPIRRLLETPDAVALAASGTPEDLWLAELAERLLARC